MFEIYEGKTKGEKNIVAESVEEERLLEFVSHMERHAMGVPALHESKKGMLSVSKDDLLTICGAAAVTYESEKWRQKEIDLLERICEEGSCTLLPDDIQKELEAWKKGREAELLFSKDLQKRLKNGNRSRRGG